MSEPFVLVPVVENTPIQTYFIGSVPILVKREDLCSPDPGPSFSKIRGVVAHMEARPERVIGVLDTFHSKAGWAVSYVGRLLRKTVINYYPVYAADAGVSLRPQQLKAEEQGARLYGLKAGMSAVLYHQAKRHLRENYADSYMMPNALKLPESVIENEREAKRTEWPKTPGTLIISVSSGTVAAGVLRAVPEGWYNILHMGYSRSTEKLNAYIHEHSGCENFTLIDDGYRYSDAATSITAPFPCNPFYDLKAWKWLQSTVETLPQPILFWNIGA